MRGEQPGDAAVVKAFSDLYWLHRAPWTKTSWLGTHVAKDPFDLWVYQEIIVETRPNVIIECGTNAGGSALFFASVFDALRDGEAHEVVTFEINDYRTLQPTHPKIIYLQRDTLGNSGSRIEEDAIVIARRSAWPGRRVMVSLDSLHTYEQVSKELELYAPLVTPGCYAVVEDTVVDEAWGVPAARAAVHDFVAHHPEFEIDKSREHHLFTLFPDGWLRRKS